MSLCNLTTPEFFPESWQSEMEADTNYLIEQAAKPPDQPAQVQLVEKSPSYITVRWFKPIDNSALIYQYEVSIGPRGNYVGHGNPTGMKESHVIHSSLRI